MLFILYGAPGKLREACKEFFTKKNFSLVKKYSALLGDYLPPTPYEPRELLSSDELHERCDFFYEIAEYRMLVGFEQSQIVNAARGGSDAILTLSTHDPSGMDMLRRIKQHYGDYVTLLYMYVEEPVLASIMRDYGADERAESRRIEIGKNVRRAYFENLTLFDHVVVSGIKDGDADYEMIELQLETIYKKRRELEREENGRRYVELPYNGPEPYVFVSYSHKDWEVVDGILFQLQRRGYRIWFDDGIKGGASWKDVLFQKIKSAELVLFVRSDASVYSKDVRAELETAREYGKAICQIALKSEYLNDYTMEGLDMYMNRTQKVLYQHGKSFFDKLEAALPQETRILKNDH